MSSTPIEPQSLDSSPTPATPAIISNSGTANLDESSITDSQIAASPSSEAPPKAATDAVLVKSVPLPSGTPVVQGYDFNSGLNFNSLFESYLHTGFQATNLGRAVNEINRMLDWRLSDEPITRFDHDEWTDPAVRAKTKCKIFLGFTSNMVSCGIREIIRFLVQHNMVQCIVTTAGAIEEDIMKCLHPHYMGSFGLNGRELRLKGQNRIGNLIVPNENYCSFEDWLNPVLDQMLVEQNENGTIWSPSKMIRRFGKIVDNPNSVLYWAAKNYIPVFSPALTDGSVGDMVFFMTYRNPGLIIDIAQDIRGINEFSIQAKGTGAIILGGGLIKHHILNANLMRNGANFCVLVTTATEHDGSDSGARPDEAISWGKIKIDAKPVKVIGDASIIFPILVSQTFAKRHWAGKSPEKMASNSKDVQ